MYPATPSQYCACTLVQYLSAYRIARSKRVEEARPYATSVPHASVYLSTAHERIRAYKVAQHTRSQHRTRTPASELAVPSASAMSAWSSTCIRVAPYARSVLDTRSSICQPSTMHHVAARAYSGR
eukprot:2345590-Rhodomonas_salina.2